MICPSQFCRSLVRQFIRIANIGGLCLESGIDHVRVSQAGRIEAGERARERLERIDINFPSPWQPRPRQCQTLPPRRPLSWSISWLGCCARRSRHTLPGHHPRGSAMPSQRWAKTKNGIAMTTGRPKTSARAQRGASRMRRTRWSSASTRACPWEKVGDAVRRGQAASSVYIVYILTLSRDNLNNTLTRVS